MNALYKRHHELQQKIKDPKQGNEVAACSQYLFVV